MKKKLNANFPSIFVLFVRERFVNLKIKHFENNFREIEAERQRREVEIYQSLKAARLQVNKEAEMEQGIRQKQYDEQGGLIIYLTHKHIHMFIHVRGFTIR